MCHNIVNAARVRAGQSQIGFDPRFHCPARCLGLEKVSIEAFKRIEPVMIAGNCIDRLFEPLEREIELGLIILIAPAG